MRLLPGRSDYGRRRLLKRIPDLTDDEINANITNICRCGAYYPIRKAIHRAAAIRNGRA